MSVIASRPPPPPLGGAAFSTTVIEALFERLLMFDVHATVNFKLKEEPAGAYCSVIVWLPLVAFAPGHPSLEPPPLPVQFVALVDCHVMVIDWPAVNEVGEALTVTLTGRAV